MSTRRLLVLTAGFWSLVIAGAVAQPPDLSHPDLVVSEIRGPALTVHFMDVDQGDAILLQAPDGEALLIDTGPRKKTANPTPYLKSLGVTRLDHLLITHSHQDHTGGFQWVAKELSLGEFWWSGYFHPTGTGERILAKVAELGIPVRKLKRGDELSLGRKQEVRIQVLNPPADMVPVDHDINNHSVVLRVSYGDIDFLLMGDAEIKAERMILGSGLAVDSEFLKLGHHGSDTASTLPFLKAVAPAFGVISCGRNNKYDHPHPSTLENLTHQGVTILRTDEVGTVVVRTDGQKVSVNVRGRRAGELLRLRLEDISHLIIGRRESTDEAMPGPAPCLRPDPDQWIRLGRAA